MSNSSSSSLREDVFRSTTYSTMTNICLVVTIKKKKSVALSYTDDI